MCPWVLVPHLSPMDLFLSSVEKDRKKVFSWILWDRSHTVWGLETKCDSQLGGRTAIPVSGWTQQHSRFEGSRKDTLPSHPEDWLLEGPRGDSIEGTHRQGHQCPAVGNGIGMMVPFSAFKGGWNKQRSCNKITWGYEMWSELPLDVLKTLCK